ncbi:MAG: hypothetical protein F4Y86_08735, partial [Gammaproteobacteria bacterium]|nr:hypothetical protein [Gammaproteobacteria bacterium]
MEALSAKCASDHQGKRRLVITEPEGEAVETLILKWRQIPVFEGEHVERGEVVSEGPERPHGLKENVVVERLIPAGTGLNYHRDRPARAGRNPSPIGEGKTQPTPHRKIKEALNWRCESPVLGCRRL